MPREDTQFKPGNKMSPGRPKGSKDKLSFAFVEALSADFDEHGADTIKKLRELSPGEYSRVIVSVLPKDINLDGEIRNSVISAQPALSAEEWKNKHKP